MTKVWLPYPRTGAGVDVYCENLARALEKAGLDIILDQFGLCWGYLPWPLKFRTAPANAAVAIANSQIGFAFRSSAEKLVIVAHHSVFDREYAPYRNVRQKLIHELLVRRLEEASFEAADVVVAVSRYTAQSIEAIFGLTNVRVILNGIDTEYFFPGPEPEPPVEDRPVRLLFVGNLIRRKGADLLPAIISKLGDEFILEYTSGLRTDHALPDVSNMRPLGRLNKAELRDAYRRADMLLFPTRFEGFGLVAAEAMACGTPVVTTNCSSLPEVVDDNVTGKLCAVDDVDGYVQAVRDLARDRECLEEMGRRARAAVLERFTLRDMAQNYIDLFNSLRGVGPLKEGPPLSTGKRHDIE